MNTYVRPESWPGAEPVVEAPTRRRFHVEILACMAAAAPVWLDLERSSALSSPFQRHTWAASWQESVGRAEGTTPFIVVGRDESERVAFLWPLCRGKLGPHSVVCFCGGLLSFVFFLFW